MNLGSWDYDFLFNVFSYFWIFFNKMIFKTSDVSVLLCAFSSTMKRRNKLNFSDEKGEIGIQRDFSPNNVKV